MIVNEILKRYAIIHQNHEEKTNKKKTNPYRGFLSHFLSSRVIKIYINEEVWLGPTISLKIFIWNFRVLRTLFQQWHCRDMKCFYLHHNIGVENMHSPQVRNIQGTISEFHLSLQKSKLYIVVRMGMSMRF